MKDASKQTAVCATLTMELGIDIGVLERVIHLGAPNSVLNGLININRQNAEIARGQENQNNQTAQNTPQNIQNQAAQGRTNMPENMLELLNRFVQNTAARVAQRPQDTELARSFFNNIKTMLESSPVQKLIKAEIQEKWVLTPQDLAGGPKELSGFYNRLNNSLHKFSQLLQLFNRSSAENINNNANANNLDMNARADNANNNNLYMQTQNVRDNLSIMNEISKTMPFLQIPLKFSNNKIINSDLYIFNNKKRRSASPVKSVNAMIKLELENLGGVDVYVNITGKNARARFVSDKGEAVEEITKNLPELNEMIYKLGFNFTSAAASAEKDSEFDILDDFINRETPKTEIRKYILNKKI
jgi:hypothetical protein